MANNILTTPHVTGKTVYGLIFHADGTVRDVVAGAWDTFADADIGDYDTACTEIGTSSGRYAMTFPALTAGVYSVVIHEQAGGSPAVGDPAIFNWTVDWDGSAFVPQSSILADTNELQTDDVPGLIAALNNVSSADVTAACTSSLNTYDSPTKAEMDAAFTEIKGATWSGTTDTLEALRDRGDAAWVTATSVTVSDKTGFKLASDGLDLVTAWTVAITGNVSGSVGSVTADVTTDSASRTASKADVSTLATTTELNKVPKSDGTTSWNATALAAINAEADTALTDYGANTTTPPTAIENADALLGRNVSNVEATAGEHTLCTLVLAGLEWIVSGDTLTIYRTDGTTTHATKTLTTPTTAEPVRGVA